MEYANLSDDMNKPPDKTISIYDTGNPFPASHDKSKGKKRGKMSITEDLTGQDVKTHS